MIYILLEVKVLINILKVRCDFLREEFMLVLNNNID